MHLRGLVLLVVTVRSLSLGLLVNDVHPPEDTLQRQIISEDESEIFVLTTVSALEKTSSTTEIDALHEVFFTKMEQIHSTLVLVFDTTANSLITSVGDSSPLLVAQFILQNLKIKPLFDNSESTEELEVTGAAETSSSSADHQDVQYHSLTNKDENVGQWKMIEVLNTNPLPKDYEKKKIYSPEVGYWYKAMRDLERLQQSLQILIRKQDFDIVWFLSLKSIGREIRSRVKPPKSDEYDAVPTELVDLVENTVKEVTLVLDGIEMRVKEKCQDPNYSPEICMHISQQTYLNLVQSVYHQSQILLANVWYDEEDTRKYGKKIKILQELLENLYQVETSRWNEGWRKHYRECMMADSKKMLLQAQESLEGRQDKDQSEGFWSFHRLQVLRVGQSGWIWRGMTHIREMNVATVFGVCLMAAGILTLLLIAIEAKRSRKSQVLLDEKESKMGLVKV
ncbi:hypothetical protein METSCH_E00610 [Metschnikowia aff. pulcherrima]|uniref:Uncharacterized protein n=1 Tax=Metschnikowia aff. pulcherrima TaxID=2163413 RepID=A0A4P6XQL7_9ASCO|nr:hypothetical protein METSCH_E00610 [Metschnikowia aff. pulcherrima]